MPDKKFATALNCMDGRTQEPVIELIKRDANVTFVDMITFPGMDGFIASAPDQDLTQILKMINISIEKHGSGHLYVVGHYDCAGNPVSEEEHKKHISQSVQRLKQLYPHLTVKGIWVDETWNAHLL
ncbi:MAG: hypothetical protein GXO48_00960 [Chlorobi bacterium]|nr:hypothetical protein [Chlorobiota bacterium]